MRRFSFFWILFAACTLCSIASGIAASVIMSYSEAQADAYLAAREGAKSANAAKAAITLLASESERDALLEAYKNSGHTFMILPSGTPPGKNTRKYRDIEIELKTTVRSDLTPDGKRRIFWIGSALDEDEWLWSRFEQPRPKMMQAAERGAAAGMIASMLGALAAFLVAKLTARYIRRVQQSASQAEKGALEPAAGNLPSEFHMLELSLQRMSRRLKSEAADREIALAGISHDAKNPLARILICAETCQDPDLEQTLTAACSQISALLDDFTEYARSSEPKNETFDLITAASNGLQKSLEPSEIVFEGFSGPFWIRGDSRLVERAFANFGDNAKKHGAMPCRAVFEQGNKGSLGRIRFCDSGTGAGAAQMRDYTKPFVRGDASRSKPGSGLGLSIAERAVQSCSGSLSFEDKPGGGFFIVAEIPAA